YIVCEAAGKLVLIDQHAAHERIGFERLKSLLKDGALPQQPLLIPQNFDLSPSDSAILQKYLEDLKPVGLEIDHFGGNTFVVKTAPILLQGRLDVKALVMDLIGDVLEKGKLTSLEDSFHEVLARMSCHGAIRAHDKLSLEEMRSLLKEMD